MATPQTKRSLAAYSEDIRLDRSFSHVNTSTMSRSKIKQIEDGCLSSHFLQKRHHPSGIVLAAVVVDDTVNDAGKAKASPY